jgi:hypothetical protein
MLRVRPIQFTSDVAAWKPLLEALGLVCVQDRGDWVEFDAGSGKVALHRTAADSPQARAAFGSACSPSKHEISTL